MKYSLVSLRVVRFGAFEADLRGGQLRKNGLKVKLQDQPFQILVMLLEHAGEVVTREELHQRLWPADTFTDFDHGLNNAINRLREALRDSADKPRYVETLPRRGYRFIAAVDVGAGLAPPGVAPDGELMGGGTRARAQASTPAQPALSPLEGHRPEASSLLGAPERSRRELVEGQGVPLPEPGGNGGAVATEAGPAVVIGELPSQPLWPLRLAAITAMLVVAVAVGWYVWHRSHLQLAGATPDRIRSVAVLPLENVSGVKEQEYFADGLTDALITNLAEIGSLRVISRTSTMRYRGTTKPLAEIARELNVEAIVEGEVLHWGGRVRITAQLIQASTDRHLWAATYVRDLRDVLALQGDVAQAIAREVQIKLTPQEQSWLTSKRPVDPEAYETYLKGYYFWNKRTEAGLRKSLGYFQQAVDRDPGYAPAYLGLADAYNLLGVYSLIPSKEAFPKAEAAATKALTVDNGLDGAHAALAVARLFFDWDWAAAEREFKEALKLNPNNATVHQYYGEYLVFMGQPEEAIAEYKRARELDPLSLDINAQFGRVYRDARRYDEAVDQCRKTLELDPNFTMAHWCLGLAYVGKKMYTDAIREFQKARAAGGCPCELAGLGYAYAVADNRDEALSILRQMKTQSQQSYPFSCLIAEVYAGLGDKDRAFEWLNRAYKERDGQLTSLGFDPFFDSLRSDPRFADLVRRMGLPP
jgi:TolB-like protein/DNA-binding winged helix-turn-helix (wHTH) protein/Tfp pilus assembly protein PilF